MDELTSVIGQNNLLLIIIFTIVAIVLILGLRITASIRSWKVQQAILDIQKSINEINERQKK